MGESSETQEVEPGWYPDPEGSEHFRYWNGRTWTSDLATSSPVTLAAMAELCGPSPPRTVAPDRHVSSGSGDADDKARALRDPWTWMAIVASVAAVIAVVACVIVAGSSSSHPATANASAHAPLPAETPSSVLPAPTSVPASPAVSAVPPPTPGARGPVTPLPSGTSSDQATADRSILAIDDLPPGWTGSASDSTGGGGSASSTDPNSTLMTCLGVSGTKGALAEASSPRFDSPTGIPRVIDQVTVWSTAKAALADQAISASPKMPGCLATIFGDPALLGLRAGQSLGKVTGTSGPIPGYGANIEAIDVIIPILSSEKTVLFHVTMFDVVVGRSESILTEGWFGTTLPAALSQPLLRTVVARMQTGPGFN